MKSLAIFALFFIFLLAVDANIEQRQRRRKRTCPPPTGDVGACVEACDPKDRFSCGANQVCCSNGCGHECVSPDVVDCSAVLCLVPPEGCVPNEQTRDCCDYKCPGCEYKGKHYENGETFMDQCNSCTCSGGAVGCTKMACNGCEYNGKWYNEGDQFKDKCNSCSCTAGSASCTDMACNGCEYKGAWHNEGETFRDECNSCACNDGHVVCTMMACSGDDTPDDGNDGDGSPDCRIGGCSGQLCHDANTDEGASTCEWRCDYGCYQHATCILQATGTCGWTSTQEFNLCVAACGATAV